MSSFEERRQQALENTCVLIGRAQIADRQVSDILYQNPYYHANASRPVPVPVAIVKPNQTSRISPPLYNKQPLKRLRTRSWGPDVIPI